jgi:peptidyl-Lys metalloendopeptidase
LFALVAVAFCDIKLHIELSSDSFVSGDELVVEWKMKSSDYHSILRWGTPLESDWNADMFTIESKHNGEVEYQGRLMKRGEPEFSDFELIAPNELKEGSLVLSDGYKFFTEGTHSVTLDFMAHMLTGKSFHLQSNTVTFVVERPHHFVETHHDSIHTRNVGFNGCSASEISTVNAAIPNAVTASAGASLYMNQTGLTPSCDSAFVTWFGTYTSSRWNEIQTDFTRIHARLSTNGFNIDCTCKQPGTYAFVYPSDPTHTIHLCPVFWQASSNPYTYNSQPGTLTHEMSHFNDVAGTGDYQYGVPPCLELASDSPNVAVNNADSHEFFQESQPIC